MIMRITRKSEYALLALVHLAQCYDKNLCSVKEISEKNKIPKKFLEQIFNTLRAGGYVLSTRGPSGGFALSKPANQITVAEIFRLIEGHLAPVQSVSLKSYKATPIEQNEKIIHMMKDIRDYVAEKLEGTTIEDLIQ
jgi:Rrf2 family protein